MWIENTHTNACMLYTNGWSLLVQCNFLHFSCVRMFICMFDYSMQMCERILLFWSPLTLVLGKKALIYGHRSFFFQYCFFFTSTTKLVSNRPWRRCFTIYAVNVLAGIFGRVWWIWTCDQRRGNDILCSHLRMHSTAVWDGGTHCPLVTLRLATECVPLHPQPFDAGTRTSFARRWGCMHTNMQSYILLLVCSCSCSWFLHIMTTTEQC